MNNTTSSPIKNNGTYVHVPGYNPFYRTQAEIIAQTVSLAVLGTIVVLGNLISIITFVKTQSLRRRSHYLIICLSVADLLVGVVDFMCVYFFWTGPQWNTFIVVLEVMDTLTATASLLTLTNITIERFHAIVFPFRHRRLRFRVYVALCAFPWITATYMSCLYVTSLVYDQSLLDIYSYHAFSVTMGAFLVMTFSSIVMIIKLRQKNPTAPNQNRPSRDRKLSVTQLIVVFTSMPLWFLLPLQSFLIVLYFCKSCQLPHFNVLFVMKFLQFCNSGNNVFIYIVRMPEFRSAFLLIFCCKGEENIEVQERPRMMSTGDQNETDQTSYNRSNSNLPLYNNLQAGNLQAPYEVNNSNVHNDGARTNTNPTNQNARNCNTGSQNAKESKSRNTKKPDVTKGGDSSLDKINISLEGTEKETGYELGVTNHACETEASGIEDSRL